MILKFNKVLFLIFLLGFSLNSFAVKEDKIKELELTIRKIGDRLLSSSGDSTSRVLPLQKQDNTYILRFEKDFALMPEVLIELSHTYMRELGWTEGIIIEVKDCDKREVVHSFKVNIQENGEGEPCQVRELPKNCYYIEFNLLGKKERAGIKEEASDEVSSSIIRLLIFLGLFLLVVYLYRMQKKKKKLSENPNMIKLGKFHFDKRNTELILEKQVIELTSKEADLLILLYENANETVERETILNRVWGDEGDYVGRTLDVFISKLRKKLEADPNVKISNIRGVGYRLVV